MPKNKDNKEIQGKEIEGKVSFIDKMMLPINPLIKSLFVITILMFIYNAYLLNQLSDYQADDLNWTQTNFNNIQRWINTQEVSNERNSIENQAISNYLITKIESKMDIESPTCKYGYREFEDTRIISMTDETIDFLVYYMNREYIISLGDNTMICYSIYNDNKPLPISCEELYCMSNTESIQRYYGTRELQVNASERYCESYVVR